MAKTGCSCSISRLMLRAKSSVSMTPRRKRLTDSPVCLIADDGDMDMHLERLLKQHRQIDKVTIREC